MNKENYWLCICNYLNPSESNNCHNCGVNKQIDTVFILENKAAFNEIELKQNRLPLNLIEYRVNAIYNSIIDKIQQNNINIEHLNMIEIKFNFDHDKDIFWEKKK